MKKLLWAVIIIVVLFVAALFVIMRISPNAIPTDTPVIGKLTCPYPVAVAGDSMAPALTAGKRVMFDRCFGDRLNLAPGTIIAFEDNNVVRISRIIEKVSNTPEAKYKTAQDNKPTIFAHVTASQIIATYK